MLDTKSDMDTSCIEEQENLDTELLRAMEVSKKFQLPIDINAVKIRPPANFIDLMNWAEDTFKFALKDQKELNKFVHNRIIIDGQFCSFCKEKNVEVDLLYKDSIVSWKTDNNFEKFFIQGAFLIKKKDLEFLQCTLYHKGNQNEDEISFFIIVSNKNYEKYLEFRNEFDAWSQERDRSNLHIRVIDGEDIPYTRDYSWDDLFLPEPIKLEIKSLVENFLVSQEFYIKNKIPWKRGVLLYGLAGNGKTSIIRTIMSVYNFKPITITSGANDESIREAFSYAEEQSPSLLYFEDLDSLLEKNIDISTFLNLMDGISSKNGILVVATANDIKKLKSNITDRPSRFDRKFDIPLPNQEMAYIYLKRWFGKMITYKKYKELAKYSEKYGFSYAYLKELFVSSMFEAISNNRKTPTEKDVNTAIERLIKDKNLLNVSRSVNMDRYL